jgi:hypothetical protein
MYIMKVWEILPRLPLALWVNEALEAIGIGWDILSSWSQTGHIRGIVVGREFR